MKEIPIYQSPSKGEAKKVCSALKQILKLQNKNIYPFALVENKQVIVGNAVFFVKFPCYDDFPLTAVKIQDFSLTSDLPIVTMKLEEISDKEEEIKAKRIWKLFQEFLINKQKVGQAKEFEELVYLVFNKGDLIVSLDYLKILYNFLKAYSHTVIDVYLVDEVLLLEVANFELVAVLCRLDTPKPESENSFVKFDKLFWQVTDKVRENIQEALSTQDSEVFLEVGRKTLELTLEQIKILREVKKKEERRG